MIERGGVVHLAVVNVDGWEENLLRLSARKFESHRMDGFGPFLELEDGEAVILVQRQLVPDLSWQAKPLIQAVKVFDSRHKGGLEAADFNHGQRLRFCQANSSRTTSGWRRRKTLEQIREESWIFFKVDKADRVIFRFLGYR